MKVLRALLVVQPLNEKGCAIRLIIFCAVLQLVGAAPDLYSIRVQALRALLQLLERILLLQRCLTISQLNNGQNVQEGVQLCAHLVTISSDDGPGGWPQCGPWGRCCPCAGHA